MSAGVAGTGRGMGVVASDFDGDGRIDVLVANDAESNSLWRNRGDGTFEDIADPLGLAVNGQGLSEANMGIAFGDTDGDTLPDVLITHLYNEHTTLSRASSSPGASIVYQDQTSEAGLAVDSRPKRRQVARRGGLNKIKRAARHSCSGWCAYFLMSCPRKAGR